MTAALSYDRTSSFSALASLVLHAMILLLLGAGWRAVPDDVFTLQEISLVPASSLAPAGLGGFRELSRPGGEAGIPARARVRDPEAISKAAQPKAPVKATRPALPSLEDRSKDVRARMRGLQDATRRALLHKGGDGPVVAREESEALEGGAALTSSGGGDSTQAQPGVVSGSTEPAAAGSGKGSAGLSLSGGLASRGYRRAPKPEYPAWAREKGIDGVKVLLEITVNENGLIQPDKIRVIQSTGYRDMDLNVIQALRDWEFEPAPAGTGPQSGRIGFTYHLTDSL